MGKRDLPDIYALAEGRKPEGVGIHIRQIQIAHVIYHQGIYRVRQIKKI